VGVLETFRNAWKVQDLRRKLLFTLFIIVIFRLGVAIAVPFLDPTKLQAMMGDSGSFLNYLDILSGGAFAKSTIFALSVTPYINASIIIQLLTYALPPLERLQKEGATGRKKLNQITRYVSLAIAVFMSYAYYLTLKNVGAVTQFDSTLENIFTAVIIVACFTAGASLITWLGDQVNEKGIGNGISMILFASIISRGPSAVLTLIQSVKTDAKNAILVPIIIAVFIAMIAFIILMNNSERRIPIQYAKRVVGRKQYGGQSTHIPIKVAMSGVMPIIFAMSFMSLPSTLEIFKKPKEGGVYAFIINLFHYDSWFYGAFYFLLIIGFNYFYVSMQYNPIQIANDLRQNNGGIPGIRPGRPTSEFIQRVLSKITLIGAVFLGVIAIFPIYFEVFTNIHVAMGGTSILIVVGVALETVRTLESQMMMRHHKGFLE